MRQQRPRAAVQFLSGAQQLRIALGPREEIFVVETG
jgi:hypothetical protein